MQFNSLAFIFSFFPIFLMVYYCVRQELRRPVMILGSLVFYALSSGGNYWWVALLALVGVASYFAGFTLVKPGKTVFLVVYLCALTAILTFFKLFSSGRYLPAGMSFYLFQLAAYLIDVYRGKLFPEQKFLSFSEQVVMFPKLLSGPLMDPRTLQLQSRYCKPSFALVYEGIQQFIVGLALKVLIANRLSGLWGQAAVVGYESISTPFAWMSLVAYAMQLYFDFWGYSLMAMGIGQMLGFKLPENFRDPYASRSVGEFWRRWHASLGAWFRVNIYFPMGGSRKGNLRTVFNLLVVWAFTGIWHGIGGNYLLWAAFLVFLIINERFWLGKLLKKTYVLCHVYTVLAILLSWLPFAIGDWDQMVMYAGRLFGTAGQTLNPNDYVIWGQEYLKLLIAGVICATPLPRMIWNKIKNSFVTDILLFALFWVVVYFIVTSAQDPFMYFQY